MKHLGTVEIEQPNGEYFTTEIVRSGGEIVTGSPTNSCFLHDQWRVTIEEFASEQEALEELYSMLQEAAMGEQ